MAKEKNKTKAFGGGRRASGAAGSYKAKNYLFAIAINDYEHIDKLSNCVRDAEAVIELLTEDFEFEREEVRFICSGPLKSAFQDVAILEKTADGAVQAAKATRTVIFREMRELAQRIKKDQEEDPELKVNLLLYYSGHGWYDDFLDQGYWIPVDSELDDYSKYISNSTIRDFLSGINTHHTLLLSDSCFSGSLFASGTGKSLASTRLEKDPSRWGITAGRNEVVSDGEAGKQSPFIDSFLTELRAADTIAVQDLSTKILERVASNDKQTPRGEPLRVRGHKGGQFVFRKKANARKHFEAGNLIMRLARYQPEYARFRAAASQFEMAARLSKKPENQITYILWEARALGYAGLYTAGIESLDKGINTFSKNQDITSLQALKQALTWLREPSLLKEEPIAGTFSTTGNWLAKLTALYQAKQHGRKDCHLVQVAINEYKDPNIPRLSGCIDDAKLVAKSLKKLFGLERFNAESLFDAVATKANIIQALASLQSKVDKEDWVFIHFTGHTLPSTETDSENVPFIIPYDTDLGTLQPEQSVIGHRELHELIEGIPANHKVVIMDTDANDDFQELAKTGNYTLLLAADQGQKAHEIRLENNRTHGIFSYALAQVLTGRSRSTATQKPFMIKKIVTEKVNRQNPVFIRGEDFFTMVSKLAIDAEKLLVHLMQTFFGARNVNLAAMTEELVSAIKQLDLSFSAEEWYHLAEQLPASADNGIKIDFYEKSLNLYRTKTPAAQQSDLLRLELELASLYLSNGHLEKAKEYLTAAYGHLSEQDSAQRTFITEKLSDLKKLAKQKKYALLVSMGGSKVQSSETEGIHQDLEGWKKTLLDLGYEQENIVVLKGEEATDEEIISRFEWLAKKAVNNPAFFFFRGEELKKEEEPEEKDQSSPPPPPPPPPSPSPPLFSRLAPLSQAAKHLTVVLDGDFNVENVYASREGLDSQAFGQPLFGNAVLLPGVFEEATGQAVHQYHRAKDMERGALSVLLTTRLQQGGEKTFTELGVPDLEQLVVLGGNWSD